MIGKRRRHLLIFAAILLASCTPTGLVERRLESQLPKYLGPADAYDVDIDGLQVRSSAAERVLAVGERVRPEGAPVLDRLELELLGVRYDRDAGRLEQVESAQATVSVTASDLSTFLEMQRNVREASVELTPPDRATIRIRPTFGDFSAPPGVTVDAEGQFVSSGSQVLFEVSEVRAAGIGLGGGAARRVSREINPVVDLAGLPVTLQVKSVSVNSEAVSVEVTGDPTSFQL
ncbi:MAG: DUF2993 domain-containing protein [Leptolyngbya sp. SIO4C1]|nr:DUF2993 domain-containing protein [Leptolyngbya sp. SIO4C1]